MGDWLEFSVQTDPEVAEAVSEVFNRFGSGGAVIEQEFPEIEEAAHHDPHLITKTFIPADDAQTRRALEEALHHLSFIRHFPEPRIRLLPETEWAESWKRHYYVQHIGERIVIVPSWTDYSPETKEVAIRLDPGMAFGTGLHPSTRLSLRALERLIHPGAVVLDVGTGSGILSIAAAKMGSPSVLALDTDPLAIKVAGENVDLNGVSERVKVVHGSIAVNADGLRIRTDTDTGPVIAGPRLGGYDLTVANILAGVIIGLAPALAASLGPQGQLIVSGIIADREEAVRAALAESGLAARDRLQDGDWIALLAART